MNRVLLSNAVFSLVSGLLIWVNQEWVRLHIPGPEWLFFLISLGLIAFSVQLVVMTRSGFLAEKLIVTVIASDVAWVLLSGMAVIIRSSDFSANGIFMVILVNLVVGLFAWLQFAEYKKLSARVQS